MAISVNNGSDTNNTTANEELIDNTAVTSSFDNPNTADAEAPVKNQPFPGITVIDERELML